MIIDVTETANRIDIIKAERNGRLALVLSKLDYPLKRFDGRKAIYQIEEIVLSEEENELACVKYNEFNYYTVPEMKPFFKDGLNLFDFLAVN